MTPPAPARPLRAALLATDLRGALPPVDLRAVCLVRAISSVLRAPRQHARCLHTTQEPPHLELDVEPSARANFRMRSRVSCVFLPRDSAAPDPHRAARRRACAMRMGVKVHLCASPCVSGTSPGRCAVCPNEKEQSAARARHHAARMSRVARDAWTASQRTHSRLYSFFLSSACLPPRSTSTPASGTKP